MTKWWQTATVHACIPDVVLTFKNDKERDEYYDVQNEDVSFHMLGSDSQGNMFWLWQGIVFKAIIDKLATNRFDKAT